MKTHWKVESQSQLKYRKISDRTLLRSSAAVGRVCSPHNTILGPPGHSGHKTAVGQFLASRLSHIWSPAGHSTTYLPSLNLKIVLSFQGWRAWQRFISLMPQNLQDVKKSLVVLRGITNIQFKCRLIRGAQKGSDLRVFQGCCVNGYSYRAQARR